MSQNDNASVHLRWALLRFAVIGHLLASPPRRGALGEEIEALAARAWEHPVSGDPAHFAFSTIERWYYQARRADRDPVSALRKKVRKDHGTRPAISPALCQRVLEQYAAHASWSCQLHHDNLDVLVAADAALGTMPSYATLRRYMKSAGLVRRRRPSSRDTEGARRAALRLEQREVRSYEAEYVNGLWHLDFHVASRPVLTSRGEWITPKILGILDDRSRLCCHAQWYLTEDAECLVHGLIQAIQKRGLPRALMSDNGPAEKADEVRQGLARLGIVHELTLDYSPYQNGKQECFWAQVEGRLLAMLERCHDLTLARLNEATHAWLDREYQRENHSETGQPPLERFLAGPEVSRPSPSGDALRVAFMAQERRTQRRSDGTVSLEGRRFELPSRYRHLERVTLRFAQWDLAHVYLVDAHNDAVLCRVFPLDRARNADAVRRTLAPIVEHATLPPAPPPAKSEIAPLLQKLMDEYASSGLPPAYVPAPEHAPDPSLTPHTQEDDPA